MGSANRFLMLLATSHSPVLRLASRHRLRLHPTLTSVSHRRFHGLSQPSSSPLRSPLKLKSSRHLQTQSAAVASSFSSYPPQWPEWSNFIQKLSSAGYFQGFGSQNDEFDLGSGLPEEFRRAAVASLAFARDRAQLIERLSRRDIEVVVDNGMPFLFKNGEESVRRLRLFLGGGNSGVLNSDSEHMVDLMRILLSYASDLVSSDKNNLHNREVVESSVRNLLNELAQFCYSAPDPNLSGSVQSQFLDRYGQTPRPLRQNIEMKRGDWICPRCSFMNFARNMKCLECEEARPKRQLSGGEWECPQCDFFNYARNMVCLRCDCKRPGEVPHITTVSGSGLKYGGGSYASKADIDSRLAENEEKAQRWFSKISQLDNTSDASDAIADEDFPDIMPLRKGVNRFVVSTRKTPLERRLANAQYQRNLNSDGTPRGNNRQSSDANKALNQIASRSLDEILGHKSAASESNNNASRSEQNAGPSTSVSHSVSQWHDSPRVSNSNYAPFVPLPADMFAKKPEDVKVGESEKVETDNTKALASQVHEQTDAISGSNECDEPRDSLQFSEKPVGQTLNNEEMGEQAEKSERWFKRVAELHNVTDLASAISDEEFPEIMPMRKGKNQFVVSKRKDRSLTSPMYKRRMAMEQANNSNIVPFVPFPPDYFAKKDNQQSDGADLTKKAMDETSNSATQEKPPEKLDGNGISMPELPRMENQPYNRGNWNSMHPGNNSQTVAASRNSTENGFDPQLSKIVNPSSGYSWNENVNEKSNLVRSSQQNFSNPQASSQNESRAYPQKENFNETANSTGNASQPSENRNIRDGWSGKSLEGSLVKEPDPLDMSEEAKAERWFRRVAQIKDISELSQIPDEDFPSIMPMRKGVNRFVVSKRKTPLERRLTSTQYRKNLPIVSSDPLKEK